MDKEKELEQNISQYRKLAAKDERIDLAALAMKTLAASHENLIPAGQKRWAYLVSIAFPPFGLLFALKFILDGKRDAQESAVMCIVLTFASIAAVLLIFKILLSGAGTGVEQIQQIKPEDIQRLLQ